MIAFWQPFWRTYWQTDIKKEATIPKVFCLPKLCNCILFLSLLLVVAFFKIVFLHQTFSGAQLVPGVTPMGPYGYPGNGSISLYTFGGDPGGSGWAIVSEEEKILQEILKGTPPLWNPNQMFGNPLAHNMQMSPFFPLKLMLLLNHSPLMWDLYKLILFFLAGFFTYLYLNMVGLQVWSSLIGAASFMLSGFLVMYASFSFMDAQVMIPFLLYSTERWIRQPGPRSLGLVALGFGMTFICGYPAPVFLATAFAISYAAYRGIEIYFSVRPGLKALIRRVLSFSGALYVGAAIAAIMILPGLDILSHTITTRPPGTGWHKTHLSYFYASFLPYILEFMDRKYFDVWSGWHGFLPGVLALFAIFRRPRPIVFFFCLACLFGYLKLGGVPPVQWIAYLPMFSRIVYPRYIHPEIAISVAVLAAFGAERWLRREITGRHVASFAFGLLLVCAVFIFSQARLFGHLHLLHSAPTLLFLPALLVFLFLRLTNKFHSNVSLKNGGLLLLLLVSLELVIYTQKQRNLRYNPFTPAPYVNFLKAQEPIIKHEARILGFGPILYPPYSSAFDIDDIRWRNAVHYPYYSRFIYEFIGQTGGDSFTAEEEGLVFSEPGGKLSRFLNLANVRYLLATQPLEKYGFGSEPQRDRSTHLIYDRDIKIYENSNALPRAFIVYETIIAAHDDEAVTAMKKKDFDPAKTVVLIATNSTERELNPPPNQLIKEKGTAQIVSYSSDKVEIQADSPEPGILVLSDTFSPHWLAKIDGQKVPVQRADVTFRAVAIPGGRHVVVFEYDYFLFKWSAAISLFGLLITSLLILPLSRLFMVKK